MPPMRYRLSFLLLCLPLVFMVMMIVGGCHDKSPSSDLESSNPIVPPFASGLIQAPPDAATAHAGAEGSNIMVVIQKARERINRNPKDLDALLFLANANFDIQRYQEAEELYRRALEIESENVQARTDRATALYRLGRAKEAVEELQRALAIDYHHENALYNLGMIKLTAFNDREGAITAWTQLKEATKNTQLIAQLDTMIAKAREGAPKATVGAAGKPPVGSMGSTGPTGPAKPPGAGGKPGTLQLPAPAGQAK